MQGVWKLLIFAGILLIAAGAVWGLLERFSGFGKLPGDIVIRKGNFTFYFPLVTCLLLSVVLTIIFALINRK